MFGSHCSDGFQKNDGSHTATGFQGVSGSQRNYGLHDSLGSQMIHRIQTLPGKIERFNDVGMAHNDTGIGVRYGLSGKGSGYMPEVRQEQFDGLVPGRIVNVTL